VIDALAAWRQLTPFVPGYQWPGAVPQIGDLYPEMLAYPTQLAPPPDYRYPNPGPLSGELVYPGHGYPPRRGEDRPALSPWGRMAKGGAIGKKTVLLYNAQETGRQSSPVPILTVAGDDLDAQPCVLTLLPPLIIPLPFTGLLSGANLQNLTGEQNNLEQTGNFPGTAEPPLWPPFEAVVEWGIGGASARATVDFANGVVVPNLMASWIRVHAISPVGSAVTGTSAAYVLYAFLGPGPGVGHGRRTVWVGELTAGSESAAFPIQRFAQRATIAGADDAATPATTNATLRFWQDIGKTSCVANYVVTGDQPLPFEIPNGAAFASVRNNMGVTARFGILYTLAI
jgi:hypothetical protein